MRLSDKYECLACLLLYFLEDTYLPTEEIDDLKTIKRFIEEVSSEVILDAFKEGKEILSLGEFPYEWISNTANRFPFRSMRNPAPQEYYDWVEWMIETLKEEAIKAGKINEADFKKEVGAQPSVDLSKPADIEKDINSKAITKLNNIKK